MTDGILLRSIIDQSGISISFLARRLGCSRNRIYAILDGDECAASEIVKLTAALHLKKSERDKIFLSGNVTDSNEQAG